MTGLISEMILDISLNINRLNLIPKQYTNKNI